MIEQQLERKVIGRMVLFLLTVVVTFYGAWALTHEPEAGTVYAYVVGLVLGTAVAGTFTNMVTSLAQWLAWRQR